MVYETVPSFSPRVGDYAVFGSNNTVIIMGRDRAKDGPAGPDDGLGSINSNGKGKGTGTIHLIAGISDSDGNPDMKADKSFLYISMKSDVDNNLNLKNKGRKSDDAGSALIAKSDLVRVVSRKNVVVTLEDSKSFLFLEKDRVVISVDDGSSVGEIKKGKLTLKIDGGSYITVEKGEIVVEGDKVKLGKNAIEKVIKGDSFKKYFLGHKHPTGVGPSGPVIDPWIDENLLSKKITTE